MHLRDLTLGPPGNWKYTQPETNYTISGITFQQLVQRVAQHRTNNHLKTDGDLVDEIETAICASMEPRDQNEYCDNGPRYPATVGWKQVESFLKTAAAFLTSGAKTVPQEEAERRAAICVKCPLNVGMHGCALCRVTLDALRTNIMQATTSQDSALQACGICGCDNRAQVHIPIANLRAGRDTDYSAAPWCWKFKGGANESTV